MKKCWQLNSIQLKKKQEESSTGFLFSAVWALGSSSCACGRSVANVFLARISITFPLNPFLLFRKCGS